MPQTGLDTPRFLDWLLGPGPRVRAWQQLAEDIGGEYHPRGLGRSDVVLGNVRGWHVVLDGFSKVADEYSRAEFTRLQAPFATRDGFEFQALKADREFAPVRAVRRFFALPGPGEIAGFRDTRVADDRVNRVFLVRGNDEYRVRRLFANRELATLLTSCSSLYDFRATHTAHKHGSRLLDISSERVDASLSLVVSGEMADAARLRDLFGLMAVTLDELERMGSASKHIRRVSAMDECRDRHP